MPADPPGNGRRSPVRIGKYEVVAHIATGGMGAVYRAIDTDLHREVALKVLPMETAARPATLERFRREARSAAKLRHDNIVAIYEFGEVAGTYYLALEFVDGIDLHELVNRQGKLDPETARHILIQAARALDHAHQQGIIHRDIKPSNFLIAQKNDKLIVKLTDLGLAREVNNDEFRITRDGTTVGTVDYMSPEQARDSTAADIRSDIYSLGCTFYHMLTGNAPFPEGTLTERIYKHVEAEPPDVREFNPAVSVGLAAILRRMLAKKPEERYQTPRELLDELENPDGLVGTPGLAALEEVAGDGWRVAGKAKDAVPSPASRAPLPAPRHPPETSARLRSPTPRSGVVVRKPKPKSPSRPPATRPPPPTTREEKSARPKRKREAKGAPPWWPLAAGAGVGLVIVLILVLVLVGSGGGDPPNKVTELPKKGPVEPPQLVIKEKEPPKKEDPVPPKVPVLHEPADAAEVARLRQEIEGPLASFPDPPDRAQTFRVGRVAPPGPDGFRSLADACAAARQGGATIIEIHDNGPLFEPSVPLVSRRNLVIRAGAGYRPLLIWERAGAAKSLLAIEGGNLTLEGLDVLLKWGDEPTRKPEAPARDSLFEVSGGDFAARDCTFTAAGKLPQGISLVQLASKGGPARCRLSRCYARGDSLTLLTAKGTGVDALMDGCLIVGGEQPLLDITADGGTVFTLRLLRSTLLAGKTLARVQSPAGKDVSPTVKFLAWDALLAHPGGEPDGDLLRLGNGVADTNVTWRAVNSVYAGWGNLLASGPRQIAPNAKDDWRTLWGYRGGDKVLIDPWPRARPLAPEESGPGPYNPMGTAVHFAANSGPGPVGADLSVVPAGPASWLALLSERLITTPLPLPGGEIPEIPAGNDGRYHGGKITLKGTIDLGQFLTLKAQQGGLGPKVVLEVSGVGEQKTSPIQLQGTDLVLAFKHWNSAKPLTLVPNPTTCADREALIEVTGGSLDLIGASILFPNNIQAATPASMLRVQGGQLRLLKCYLAGPLGKAPPGYRELIHIAGSAENNTELATGCAASESVLLSGKTVLHVQGPEAQVRLQHCIVVAPGDALRFDVGPKAGPRLDLQCLLERNTIAVRGSVFHVANVPPTAGNPNLTGGGRSGIAIQAEANVFVDPFSEPQRRSAMLRFEGDVLPRGLVQWRGKGNGYDEKRLQAYAAAAGADAGRQPHETWARLWGKLAEQQAILLDWSAVPLASFGMDRPQLDCLRLPVRAEIGADLKRLGIVRKK